MLRGLPAGAVTRQRVRCRVSRARHAARRKPRPPPLAAQEQEQAQAQAQVRERSAALLGSPWHVRAWLIVLCGDHTNLVILPRCALKSGVPSGPARSGCKGLPF